MAWLRITPFSTFCLSFNEIIVFLSLLFRFILIITIVTARSDVKTLCTQWEHLGYCYNAVELLCKSASGNEWANANSSERNSFTYTNTIPDDLLQFARHFFVFPAAPDFNFGDVATLFRCYGGINDSRRSMKSVRVTTQTAKLEI